MASPMNSIIDTKPNDYKGINGEKD
jgi:hypothetical protein